VRLAVEATVANLGQRPPDLDERLNAALDDALKRLEAALLG
jgi:hypothetical protein